jgi:histidine triad (HIT) family protein
MDATSCLFCRIIRKEIPAEVIYENEATLAFLDIHPRAPGHALVIPKQHAENVLDANAESLHAVILTIQHVTGILSASLSPAGFTIGINHGSEAGQAISHLHAHILPRFKGDGGGNIHSIINNPGSESVSQIADKLRQKKV